MTDYLTDFVQESEERITELNNALLTLERDPDDEEAMENIFRIAHTLKGNCGAMGLESASDLAHAIEDLLDAVRGDEIEVTPELMDVVFDAVDELETMVDEVAVHGEIETDPSATIRALRDHRAAVDEAADAGLYAPTADEIDDVCSRFDPPADDGHDVYLARLEIAERDGVNNGELVVDALIDAFDLIGTDPPRETIEAGAYDGWFDAVFATAVGEAAIASGLEPVEEVADFDIVDVSDRFDAPGEEAEPSAAAAEPGEDISPDEAQDLEVDDLLDEFDEFDDLDEMVEEVEDEELDAFEDMGEAGSFDDLLDDEDVDELDAEPGTPPVDSLDETAGEAASDDEAATEAAAETDDSDDDVDDASAVFDELKDEVEMVGFDELQDELAELEFDEFDEEEEVEMDELLGDDAEDESFLEGPAPSESAVDDILVDSKSDDDIAIDDEADAAAVGTTAETDVGEADADRSDADEADAAEMLERTDDQLESVEGEESTPDAGDEGLDVDDGDEASDDGSEEPDVGDEEPPVAEPEANEDDLEAASSAELDDESWPVDSELEDSSDGATDRAVQDGDAFDGSDDGVVDETVVNDAVTEETADDETGAAESIDDDSDEPVEDTGDGITATDSESDDVESIGEEGDAATDDTADADSTDDPLDSATADDATDPETDGAVASDESDDAATTESFEATVSDEFEPTTVDDGFETSADDTAAFEDENIGGLTDETGDESGTDPVELEADADDGFEAEFDDSLDDQLDDEAFAGTDEFDAGEAGFDSPASNPDPDADSSLSSASGFGDDSAETDDEDDDVVRIVEEPEMEVPDIAIPDRTDRPDADAETDEIQSVRVDVEQIDSLLTLVEGLVTSRVRLRHAVDADDEREALETELDALSDLTTDLQETVMDVRLVPLKTVTSRLPRVVRDIARDQDKEVAFSMTGEDVELDRSILDRIGDPLIHLVRNAVDHGIERPDQREDAGKPREGTVEVHADRSSDRVTITVEDDGSGLDPDRLRSEAVEAGIIDEAEAVELPDEDVYDLIFQPGFSTVDEVTDVSGRGVGMDVVKRTIEDLDGTVSIDSTEGDGTTVTMRLPVTVAIDEILFVESGGEEFGVPTKAVQDIESAAVIETAGTESVLPADDGDYPVISLADVLETSNRGANGDGMVVRIRDEIREVALHCDTVHGQQEVVVKPFEGFMSDIPGLSGATVRGRGEVVNILDVTTL